MKKNLKKIMEMRKNERKKGWKEGFTFVETLGVLAIGAALTAGTTVSVSKLVATAKRTSAKNQIEEYSSALQSYFLDCGRFPTTEQGLNALWEKPEMYPVPDNWNGPYLEKKPALDPWGEKFGYISAESTPLPQQVNQNIPFVLYSYGPDKTEGGVGNNADICSWE